MSDEKTQTELLHDISEKLDIVMGFLVARSIGDSSELVERLHNMGLGPKAIAPVVGISENAAGIRVSRLKKKSIGKQGKKE